MTRTGVHRSGTVKADRPESPLRRTLLIATLFFAGCAPIRFEGANPRLVDFKHLADSFVARRLVDDRVRTFAVLTHLRHVPRRWQGGQQYVLGTFYRVDPDASQSQLRCDFGVRSGGVSVLIPAQMARHWRNRSADTVFALTGRVQMREHGLRDVSPTPLWFQVDHGVAMGTCQRPHPLIAPPSLRATHRG